MAEYYGTKELAQLTGYKQQTMQKWCHDGKFPTAEQDDKGSPWRVAKDDIKLLEVIRTRSKNVKKY